MIWGQSFAESKRRFIMILTVCMSPCIDVTVEVDALNVGKTNVVKRKAITLGGKALNVAIGVKRLGEESFATGLMYSENGQMFESLLHNEGVPYSFALPMKSSPCTSIGMIPKEKEGVCQHKPGVLPAPGCAFNLTESFQRKGTHPTQ